MAKVTLVFEDIGLEGNAQVSYDGDPDFDIDSDSTKFTSAQLMAAKCLQTLIDIANEDPEDEIKKLPPLFERH